MTTEVDDHGAESRRDRRVLNAFTVDVEDYFQVSAFETRVGRDEWDRIPLRLERGLDELLEIAAAASVQGTFYVLGWLAERRPDLLRRIVEAGHEIGCHSYDHRLVYSLTPDEFRSDLGRSLSAIGDAVGGICTLYRAPSFSITRKSLWALEILAEEGIRIDSSIYPVRHDRYGIHGAPLEPYRPLSRHPDFVEVPPATVRVLGMTLPCAGGGYLRLMPLGVTRAALRRVNVREARPVVMYVHPWELDPDQPVVQAGRVATWRHRVNLAKTGGRVRKLLGEFPFTSVSGVVDALGGPGAIPKIDLDAELA